jgi:RNA polymerase primary sigma factor
VTSYAVWWIRLSIMLALGDQARIVRLPMNKIGMTTKINNAIAHLEQEFERPPSVQEIADYTKLSVSDIKEAMKNSSKHTSLDAPLLQDEDSTMIDVIKGDDSTTPETGLLYESLRKEIDRVISTLSQKEQDVIRLYFGLDGKHPLTLEEIGEKFDLTRERVRQIKEKAIRRLKQTSRSKILKSYLG